MASCPGSCVPHATVDASGPTRNLKRTRTTTPVSSRYSRENLLILNLNQDSPCKIKGRVGIEEVTYRCWGKVMSRYAAVWLLGRYFSIMVNDIYDTKYVVNVIIKHF